MVSRHPAILAFFSFSMTNSHPVFPFTWERDTIFDGFRLPSWLVAWMILTPFIGFAATLAEERPLHPCRILVLDEESGWPVPLVELRTIHSVKFVTDNAGVIAIDDPSLMNKEVWFTIKGHGYGVDKDGFGYEGVRLNLKPGNRFTVKVKRRSIAKRIGRLTGTGLFSESQKLGEQLNWKDGVVVGCDSVQNAVYDGKLFWAWGDTSLTTYPLGIFHMTGATTSVQPFADWAPPIKPSFDYFYANAGQDNGNRKPRAIAEMPGAGPTWLTGFVSLPDELGQEHLVAFYRKIRNHLETYEAGLCHWDDKTGQFKHIKTTWRKSSGLPEPNLARDGHPSFWVDEAGKRWLYFGNPLPFIRLAANYEAWKDTETWESIKPQATIRSRDGSTEVTPHSGSIAWNEFRKRWVTVFVEKFGQKSPLGTLWYAEADSPVGPWEKASEILSHDNYTFYNPRLHPECTPPDSPVLFFEGTYTAEFADHAEPTPRYNYNQILYRLDLDSPELNR